MAPCETQFTSYISTQINRAPRQNCRVSPEISFHFQLSLGLFFRKPRTCGEKVPAPVTSCTHSGSPPHLRGKAKRKAVNGHGLRITPALAGKRAGQGPQRSRDQDHPRTCGEKYFSLKTSGRKLGSPPHMRGKEGRNGSQTAIGRITPAYAGKSNWRFAQISTIEDHPRICGEKKNASIGEKKKEGSPPHMRGKVFDLLQYKLHAGITPAYAGKRVLRPKPKQVPWDHPRICGEKSCVARIARQSPGSPPHMRGKETFLRFPKSFCRITPAYAGKSYLYFLCAALAWDHPRICGEKKPAGKRSAPRSGSPPHMRGKAAHLHQTNRRYRITPAYAGKSRCACVIVGCEVGSPPHMRGKDWNDHFRGNVFGSPPHMRGKDHRTLYRDKSYGITPAYAGKSQ